jgi:uncharacterized Ntn-hydrolase superfamily protein
MQGRITMRGHLRTIVPAALASAGMTASGLARDGAPRAGEAQRPVATYSILARDPATGALGVAVQSHWFSVGSVVSWAEAGVGAVATQSFVEPAYGPLGLELMRAGHEAPQALRALLAGDETPEVRQVSMIDAHGRVASHTGRRCIAAAGQIVDEEGQFSVQANLMATEAVWPAMARAYRETSGDLADRLLATLEAAEAAGGDIRGRQSAAILVVSGAPTGRPWNDRIFDLRVEDHSEPLRELRRLVVLQRAYLHMNAGDRALEEGDLVRAGEEYAAAQRLAPDVLEIPFWHAVTLAGSHRLEDSLPVFHRVFAREPAWAELVPRLVPAGLLPDDPEAIRRIRALAPRP